MNTKTTIRSAANRGRFPAFAAALLLAAQCLLPATPAGARQIADPDPTEDTGGASGGGWYYVFPADGFSWTAPDRYDLWDDNWRSREQIKSWDRETYKPGYVNPTDWKIPVMGCQTENDFLSNIDPDGYEELHDEDPEQYPLQKNLYRWSWNGNTTTFTKKCNGILNFPKEGVYEVTMTVRRPDNSEQTWTNTVQVKDFLVVVLGDSSASGEGAPDVTLTEAGGGRAQWVDNRCHRSMNAGGAQAARRLEYGDTKTSVTFVSFACSGATLASEIFDGGLLDPYEDEEDYDSRGVGVTAPYAGIEPTTFIGSEEHDYRDKVPSQVEQLWNALTDFGAHQPRKIDALIVAGGINDARFADLAVVCVLNWGCHLGAQLVGETPGIQRSLDDQFHHDLESVPTGYETLRDQLAAPRLLKDGTMSEPIEAVEKLALSYPPFFRDDEGDMCPIVLHDSLPAWVIALYVASTPLPFSLVPPGWTVDEISHAESVWAPHLNEAVEEGADRAGFTFVDTIPNRFDRHGICADDAYINTPTVSAETQGNGEGEAGVFASLSSKGAAHPNTKGYSAYADEILRNLDSITKKTGGNTPPIARADKVSGAKFKPLTFNVLTNDEDADEVDVLSAKLNTQPQHGTVTMQLDGTAVYKPGRGYYGEDRFLYEVTDGTDSRFAEVKVTIRRPILGRVTVTPSVSTEITEIFEAIGTLGLHPPYNIVFDEAPGPDAGNFYFEPEDGLIYYDPPAIRRRTIRLNYTVYSELDGESFKGKLVVKMRRVP